MDLNTRNFNKYLQLISDIGEKIQKPEWFQWIRKASYNMGMLPSLTFLFSIFGFINFTLYNSQASTF